MAAEDWKQRKLDAMERLRAVGSNMETAKAAFNTATDDLLDLVTWVRSLDRLPVNEMARVLRRERNYVDSTWSDARASGRDKEVDGSWFGLSEDSSDAQLLAALAAYGVVQSSALDQRDKAQAARNKAVCEVYRSKDLGPTAIGAEVGMTCNHVLRVVRRSGIRPLHRTNIRNQHTAPVS